MPDNPNTTGRPDRERVSLSQDHEVDYWTERFAVTEDRLREAVATAGNSVTAVARFLLG